jgi:hypothetical protein
MMMRLPERPQFVLLFIVILFGISCHGRDDRLTPVPLVTPVSVGAPVTDSVTIGSFNRYTVLVQAGAVYKISITGMNDDADLLFFGTDGTFWNLAACSIDTTSMPDASPEDCLFIAPAGRLYFAVDGTYLASTVAVFTLAVESVNTTPLSLSVPILDSTTRTGAAAYTVPVTAGTSYTVALTELDGDADLHVFRDAGLTEAALCAFDNLQYTGTTPEDCTLTADSGTLYFVVDGLFSSNPDVLFTAFASPSAAVPSPANEGSVTPVQLTLDNITGGQVGPGGTSRYSVSGLTPGSDYTVSINGLTQNVDLVNTDSSFSAELPCSIDNTFYELTTPESCTEAAPAGGALFFKVTAPAAGSGYLILAEPGP